MKGAQLSAIRIENFEGEAFRDPAVRAVLPRVHAAAYTTAQFPADNHLGAEVKVTSVDGKVVFGKIAPHSSPPTITSARR